MRCAGKHMKGVTGCACEGSKSLLLHFCRHRFGKKATQALGDRGKGRSWASHLGLCSSCHPGSHSPAPAIVPIPGLRDRACVPIPPDHTTTALQETPYPALGTHCLFISGGSGEKVREAACQEYAQHTPLQSECCFSLAEFLTPLMRQRIKNKMVKGKRVFFPWGWAQCSALSEKKI